MIKMNTVCAGPKGVVQPGKPAVDERGNPIFSPAEERDLVKRGMAVEFGAARLAPVEEETGEEIENKVDLSEVKATPAAMKLAEENNLDISGLQGTGQNGFITKGDVAALMASQSDGSKD